MALPRPSVFLDWTDGNASKQAQPPAGQKLSGWVANQKGPFRFWNWLFYTTDLWIKYFDSITYSGQAVITAATTWDGATRTQLLNPTAGAFNYTLPLAVNYGGQRVTLKNIAALGSNNANIVRSGADTIEGDAGPIALTPRDAMTFEAEAASNTWWLVSAG